MITVRRGLSILFLLALAACQSAAIHLTETPSGEATAALDATVTPQAANTLQVMNDPPNGAAIQVWYPWYGVEANLFQAQVDEFNQTNQWNIKVQAASQSDYNELFHNVESSLSTGSNPQLAIGLPEYESLWNTTGSVIDLTDYVSDSKYGLSAGDIKDIPSVFWNQDEVNGQRLGIPAERSARFLLYNESWARDLGFDAAPLTSDDFRKQACAAHLSMLKDNIRTNDATGGWLVDTQALTALSWLKAFGGGVVEGNSYRFLTPENISAFTFVKQLYDDGCAWTTTDPSTVYDSFANRKALFSTASLEELSDQMRAFAAANNSDEWSVLAFPGSSGSGLYVYGSSYIVLKSTPQQQLAAWLFVRWMLSPENQAKWVEALGMFPLRASSLDLLTDYSTSHPQWKAAVAHLPYAQMEPQFASWRVVQVMLGDAFNNMFATNIPAGSVAKTLAQMDSTVRDLSK
jgi:multiple sugar transport system substrate-binding protein